VLEDDSWPRWPCLPSAWPALPQCSVPCTAEPVGHAYGSVYRSPMARIPDARQADREIENAPLAAVCVESSAARFTRSARQDRHPHGAACTCAAWPVQASAAEGRTNHEHAPPCLAGSFSAAESPLRARTAPRTGSRSLPFRTVMARAALSEQAGASRRSRSPSLYRAAIRRPARRRRASGLVRRR